MFDYDDSERRILSSRAQRLASLGRRVDADQRERKAMVVLGVGNEQLGLAAAAMIGVVPAPPIAALPGLPAWMPGIVEVRGEVLSAISIARWFEIDEGGDESHVAVVESERGALALLVDRVLGFRNVGPADIAERFAGPTSSGRPLCAVTRDLLAIVDIPALFAGARLWRPR